VFKAPDTAAGKKAKCPKCGGVIEIPAPAPQEEIFEAEEAPRPFDDGFAVEPPPAQPAADDRKPCPMCGEMIQSAAVKCRYCGEIFDPMLKTYQRTTARAHGGDSKALFLHIPVSRLLILSILSMHLYEAYWIYKNWRYAKERDDLSIWPFWRGIFGIFFCHSLLKRIHDDPQSNAAEPPTFSPGGLATGWVLLVILGNLIDRVPGMVPLAISAILPSFLCLVPVQKYVNAANERRNPSEPYYRWSWGHILCIVFGIIAWLGVLTDALIVTVEP
jgi:hypothetical protein